MYAVRQRGAGKHAPLTYSAATDENPMVTPDADVTVHAVFRRVDDEPVKMPNAANEIEGADSGYVTMPSSTASDAVVSGTILPKDGWSIYSTTATAGNRDLVLRLDVDDGTKKLNPRVQCTRAELATILMRMDEDGIL